MKSQTIAGAFYLLHKAVYSIQVFNGNRLRSNPKLIRGAGRGSVHRGQKLLKYFRFELVTHRVGAVVNGTDEVDLRDGAALGLCDTA